MRKCFIILLIAALFLFSGWGFFHFGSGNNKPSPSVSEESPTKPSIKPSPSADASTIEDESPAPSHASGGYIFGSCGNFSNSGGTKTNKPEGDVQDAQIRTYSGQSLDSRDDIIYTDNASVRADYDGDGIKDVLNIDFHRRSVCRRLSKIHKNIRGR